MPEFTNSEEDGQIPLACRPGAITPENRQAHFELLSRLFKERLRERRVTDELPNGYEFRFDPDAFADLMRFMSNERRCCPFLAFDLRVFPNEGPIWLRMSGPPGTRAFLDEELQPQT